MIRVLIVDDDPLARAGLRFIFESVEDIEVVAEAQSGRESIAHATRLNPDVVLMDMRMPWMDGREATEKLVKLPNPPKILALTTFDADAVVLSALDAGASGYLLKDTPPAGIIDAVKETAEGRTILSTRHAGVLLENRRRLIEKYSENDRNAGHEQAVESLAQLTEREREVVHCVARGLTNAEIAESLHCSPATVKAHLANIFTRLHIPNRVRLAILGHDAGLSDGGNVHESGR